MTGTQLDEATDAVLAAVFDLPCENVVSNAFDPQRRIECGCVAEFALTYIACRCRGSSETVTLLCGEHLAQWLDRHPTICGACRRFPIIALIVGYVRL